MSSLYIGVDIGGTNVVCGLVDEQGQVLHTVKQPTGASRGSDAVLRGVADAVERLAREAEIPLPSAVAVGVGTPGLVDPQRGITLHASNLGWKDVPVAAVLSEHLQLPVYIDNDVRMYVFGEATAGAGKGFRTVMGITLGTGMAMSVVQNGNIYYGAHYMAGELGHLAMDGIPYRCACGLSGCLETVVSATGLVRQVREALANGTDSSLGRLPSDRLTAAAVSEAYDAGDPLAVQVFNNTGRWLGLGLSYAITLFNPDILIIGGGMAAAGERLFRPMKEQLRQSLLGAYLDRLVIAPARHPDHAGVIGSAMSAKVRHDAHQSVTEE